MYFNFLRKLKFIKYNLIQVITKHHEKIFKRNIFRKQIQ